MNRINDPEALTLQQSTIFGDTGKIPGIQRSSIDSVLPGQHLANRPDHCVHISFAAKFGDEPSARLQTVPYAGDHLLRILHPMQCGVGEYRIERLPERKILGIAGNKRDFGILRCRFPDHLSGEIHARHICSGLGQFISQIPGAAAQVQNSLPFCGIQQVNDASPKL
ncbi:hypothetical protein D3C71_1526490 [compost metagenome]